MFCIGSGPFIQNSRDVICSRCPAIARVPSAISVGGAVRAAAFGSSLVYTCDVSPLHWLAASTLARKSLTRYSPTLSREQVVWVDQVGSGAPTPGSSSPPRRRQRPQISRGKPKRQAEIGGANPSNRGAGFSVSSPPPPGSFHPAGTGPWRRRLSTSAPPSRTTAPVRPAFASRPSRFAPKFVPLSLSSDPWLRFLTAIARARVQVSRLS